MTLEQVLTTKEVATALRVNPQTVVNWLETGKLRGFRLPGGTWRVTEGELKRIMAPVAPAQEETQQA